MSRKIIELEAVDLGMKYANYPNILLRGFQEELFPVCFILKCAYLTNGIIVIELRAGR